MIKEQGYAYWEPGQARPSQIPEGCEYLDVWGIWVECTIHPAGWGGCRRRWPAVVNPEIKALKQEIVNWLEQLNGTCIRIEAKLTDSCEECGRNNVCKTYTRLQQLKKELE